MIYVLNNASIVGITDEIESFLKSCGLNDKAILQTRLACEEVLLKYQEVFMQNSRVKLKCSRTMRRLKVELSVAGGSMNPFAADEEGQEYSDVLHAVLVSMGIAPSWQYKNGENIITFTPEVHKRSQLAMLVLSVFLAVAIGFSSLLLSQEKRLAISALLLSPLLDTFMGLLSAVSGPMIFLSVVIGICSIGDTAMLGRIGKKMISHFIGKSLLIAFVIGLAFSPFFDISSGNSSVLDLSAMLNMVLDVIPENIFTPFTEQNPLQIIFVAVMLGLSLLVLGGKISSVQTLLEQTNYIIQLAMGAISAIVPVFVFISILNMMLSSNFSVLVSSYKLVPILLLGDVLVMGAYLIAVSASKKVKIFTLIKKLAPTFLITIATSSSAAAYPTNTECCEKYLGIDRRITNFAIPLGQVVFMPGAIVLFLTAGLCLAEVYGVAISPAWVFNAMVISFVLAVAAPPVPGGALTCYTMLVVQLGLPAEAIAIAIAFNVILEFVSTAVNVAALQLELVELAGSLGMLDRKVLAQKTVQRSKSGA